MTKSLLKALGDLEITLRLNGPDSPGSQAYCVFQILCAEIPQMAMACPLDQIVPSKLSPDCLLCPAWLLLFLVTPSITFL